MREFIKKRKLNIICSVAAVCIAFLVWIIAYYAVANDYIVPSFPDTAKQFFCLFAEGAFWTGFSYTLLRSLTAFLISFVLAAVFAALSAVSRAFALTVRPLISFLRTLPTLAVTLMLLIWTSAAVAPVAVAALVMFPMLYAEFTSAEEGIDVELRQMLSVYGVSAKKRLFKVYLPLISKDVFSRIGADFSLCIKITVSGEVLAVTFRSLGGLMQEAKYFAEMPRLAALTVAAVLFGLFADIALSQLARINNKWAKGGVSVDRL